ncbi:MAG TPA: LysE family transporter [Polyangiaceae bacterium]|jgi:threonine/homoserine/homoserine lactone efflux protein
MSFVAVSLVALVFAFVGSLPLAGPIAVLVVSNGVQGRYRDALKIALGAAVAEGVYAFLAFWGFATFLARYALLIPVSHAVTAAVLASLGVHFLFFEAKEDDGHGRVRESKRGRFWFGFSVSALNPTLLATWGAVTTFLYSKQIVHMTSLLAVPFGVFAALGVALWGWLTVLLLKRFRNHVPRVALTWTVRGMGILLIGIAAWSVVELAHYITDPSARTSVIAVRGVDER